jgi:hypothetical protein
MLSMALFSIIADRVLQTFKQLNLVNLALVFAATLVEKISLQALGGLVSETIVQSKDGLAKFFVAFFLLALSCIVFYSYYPSVFFA